MSTTGRSTNFILTVQIPCGVPPQPDNTDSDNSDAKEKTLSHYEMIEFGSRQFWTLRGAALLTMLDT